LAEQGRGHVGPRPLEDLDVAVGFCSRLKKKMSAGRGRGEGKEGKMEVWIF
jgi:hypothetical protein